MLLGYTAECCSCSVVTICATCNVISHLICVVYRHISTYRSVCAVHNISVFRTSLISAFAVCWSRCCLSDFEMVPVAPITSGITFAFTFHVRWIYIVRSLYFKSSRHLSWSHYYYYYYYYCYVSGVPVTTAWRVLRLRMEERPPIWRVDANKLNTQSRTADKG
jgi:hypothetical protein